jgi:hypothetical protein
MRPGIVRPGPDRQAQDGDDPVRIAPGLQRGHKIRQGARVAGFDPEGFPVGDDRSIRIAPDREQVTEDVRLPVVAGPACDRLPGHGDCLVERLQPLLARASSQKDRAQAPDVPRLRGPHLRASVGSTDARKEATTRSASPPGGRYNSYPAARPTTLSPGEPRPAPRAVLLSPHPSARSSVPFAISSSPVNLSFLRRTGFRSRVD